MSIEGDLVALLGPLAAMAGAVTFLQWAVYDAEDEAEQQR